MARGSRTRSSKPSTLGRYGDTRESWVRVNSAELVLYEYRPGAEPDEEEEASGIYIEYRDLPGYTVAISTFGRARPLRISLTNMRLDELEAFSEFINRAIELARPAVTEIDARAQRDFEENNDDTHARLYRPVPAITIRTREQREHSAGLRRRSARPAGDGGGDAA